MSQVLSVTELTSAIKKVLEKPFSALCVRGEVSNLKEQTSGHIYFTLKDKDSQVSAVLFRGDAARAGKRALKNGDEIVVKGELSVYVPRGSYQIIVREIEFAGLGELLLKLHERKKILESRGWFDASKKKKLPKHPKVIGVVTSPTGSVIQDILHVLGRRFSGFQLLLNPVKVQGEGAAEEIALAIEQMNQYSLADVLIVGRGGGSLEDLWAFNEEIVAKAIFESKIPIVTAVGHETDTCIADYVADVRAPTPSAAAEIVVSEKTQKLEFLKNAERNLTQMLKLKIGAETSRLKGFQRQPCFAAPISFLGPFYQKIDDCRETFDLNFSQRLRELKLHLRRMQEIARTFNPSFTLIQQKNKLHASNRTLLSLTQSQIRQKKERLNQLRNHLLSLHPKNILTKGYCILFRENSNSVIVSKHDIQKGEKLDILVQDGTIKVETTT